MKFLQSIDQGFVKKVQPDILKAKSLMKASEEAIATASKIPLEPSAYKSIVRELYEGLRQYAEALGIQEGYKFESHEVITYFLDEIKNEKKASLQFDKYRRIRNGINYYGDDVAPETVKEALDNIPLMINILKKHSKVKYKI